MLHTCQYFPLKALLNCIPLCTALNFHPWLQQCYLDLCGTLNDTLDPAFNQQWRAVRMKELLEFALNHAALKFNGNEVNWAVLCSRAEGVITLGSQEHTTVGTYSGLWVEGLGRCWLARNFLFGWSFSNFFPSPLTLYANQRQPSRNLAPHWQLIF